MNPEALRKLLPIAMVVLTTAQMVSTFRWMLRMGLGEVYGLPADIVLVLSVLDFVLTAYVTLQMVWNRVDAFWLLFPGWPRDLETSHDGDGH